MIPARLTGAAVECSIITVGAMNSDGSLRVFGLLALAALILAGQSPKRTPDGHPDLQGLWTNVTITPLERPRDLAGKAYFTPEEAAAYEKQIVDRRDGGDEA